MSVSLSKFRQQIFPFFQIMKDTGVSIDVHHRRKIYEVTIRPTDRRVTTPYRRSRKKSQGVDSVDFKTCPICGELMAGGVCMANKHEAE